MLALANSQSVVAATGAVTACSAVTTGVCSTAGRGRAVPPRSRSPGTGSIRHTATAVTAPTTTSSTTVWRWNRAATGVVQVPLQLLVVTLLQEVLLLS